MERAKIIFFICVVIAMFVVVPSLGRDLVFSCVTMYQGIDESQKELQESMKDNPIIR